MDDSIVLDDLVRTAEASRLRRRGATRLDPSSFITVTELSWDGDDDEEENEMPPGLLGSRARPAAAVVDYTYSLFCGVDAPTATPFTPSILPLAGPSAAAGPTRSGCGTLLHDSAAPRRRAHAQTWHALAAGASSCLVPLDAAYIDDAAPRAIYTAPCGCARAALACAICGNFLGTRLSACHAHARSTEYTFLDTAVTSFPALPHSSQPQPQPQPQTYPPLFDRLVTASPIPLTDEERTAYYRTRPTPPAQPRYSYGYGYDEDGDGDEANLDKAGDGVFVPER
ncbi:hypothetical protein C0989_002596 [Termitomyces sp. Mn162]|nr:hypothetical protein C0989_002596 [Termitomyces sp. Mn162]